MSQTLHRTNILPSIWVWKSRCIVGIMAIGQFIEIAKQYMEKKANLGTHFMKAKHKSIFENWKAMWSSNPHTDKKISKNCKTKQRNWSITQNLPIFRWAWQVKVLGTKPSTFPPSWIDSGKKESSTIILFYFIVLCLFVYLLGFLGEGGGLCFLPFDCLSFCPVVRLRIYLSKAAFPPTLTNLWAIQRVPHNG